MQNDDETGYGFVFTDPIDSGLIPMRDSSQTRADWVVENVVELVREEFPLQYGLLRSQLSKPMLDDGAPKENIDDYLYWAIRFAKTKIAYRGGFLFLWTYRIENTGLSADVPSTKSAFRKSPW